MVKTGLNKHTASTNMATAKTAGIFIVQVLFLFTLFSGAIAQAANITVSTSRNPVALDDSFHLVYEADSNVDDDPDFSPVYEYFDVLSSSQSTNMRSINGNWSLQKTWDLTVIAKDVGKFTIAPVKFGKDISPAIQVTVSNSSSPNSVTPDGQSSIPAKIFLESSVDKKSGWVQSQFIYTIRLLRTVSIANASITEPVSSDADAIIKLINEDNYQTTRNGIRYDVFERSYAIFPQKSGSLKIEPVTFEGRVNAQQPRTIFDQFRMSGQTKRLRSKQIELNVKAAPENINLQNWLPASDVQLVEEWSADIQNLTAGEPVTRTIMIAAEGLTGVQLPDLPFDDITGLKQYADKAIVEDKQIDAGITGYKQVKVALIPAGAGSYTLPEIKLPWWNTRTGKEEIAILPQVTLTVTGVANTPAPVVQSITPQPPQVAQPAEKPVAAVSEAVPGEAYWKWLTLFFAIAWLLTLLALFNKSRSQQKLAKNHINKSHPPVKTEAARVIKQAQNNNAEKTRQALIDWARASYNNPDITNLSQIADTCSSALQQEIRQLNESLYSMDRQSWQGKTFIQAFKDEQRNKTNKSVDNSPVLKPLYNK